MSYFGAKDFYYEVAAGRVPGKSPGNTTGDDTAISVGAAELVWQHSSDYVPLTVARVHDLVSTSASDGPGGAGLRAALVRGVDGSGLLAEEVVVMNGTTPVSTVGSYLRINEFAPVSAGSNEVNVGTITATAQTDNVVTMHCPAGYNRANQAIYTCPVGKQLLVVTIVASLNNDAGGASNAVLNYDLYVRANIVAGPVLIKAIKVATASRGTSNIFYPLDLPTPFPGGTDLLIKGSSNAADTVGSAGFSFILEDL